MKPFEEVLGKLRSSLPRQLKEHEVLRIAAELTTSQSDKQLRQQILRWAQRRTTGRLPEEAWREESFQHLSSGRTCMGARAITDESDVWAVRIDDPDKQVPGRVWSTETVLGRKGDHPGLFSLRLLVTTPEDRLNIEPHVPGVVLQVIGEPGLSTGGYALLDKPIYVQNEEGLQGLVDELTDPSRSLPVIALTVPALSTNPDKPSVDAATLARAVAGLARVFVIPSRFTWGLSERFGKKLSVFEGAARVYLPGFSADSNPFGGHDLFVPRNPSDGAEAADILSRLRWSVARASVRRLLLGKNVLSFAMVRNQSLLQRQRELARSGASDQEQLTAAEQRIVSLEQQLEQEQSVADEFARLHTSAEDRAEAAETQLRSAIFRVQQLLDQIKAKGDAPDENLIFPEDWEGFAEWCDLHLPGRVVLSPQGRRTLKSAEFLDVHEAAKCLLWLANQLRDSKTGGQEGSLRDAVVLPGIINAHCGSDQFEIEWQGERRSVDWHIKNNGNTRDPTRCLRIYYFWDEASQQSVIASMPGHRRSDAS